MIIKYMKDEDWAKFPNFKKTEFKCPKSCKGYPSGITYSLVETMQKIRTHYKKPINITSGLRCQTFNDSLPGSSKTSDHLRGLAVDFNFAGMNKQAVMKYIKTLPNISYTYTNEANMKNAVHLSVKPTYEKVIEPQVRNENINQLQVLISSLNVRIGVGTNQTILGYAKKGCYAFYETKVSGGYTWYRITDNQWVAYNPSWVLILPKKAEEVSAPLEAEIKPIETPKQEDSTNTMQEVQIVAKQEKTMLYRPKSTLFDNIFKTLMKIFKKH